MHSFFDHVFDLLVRGGILAVVVMAVMTAAVLIWRRYTAKKAPDKLVPLKRLVPWILFSHIWRLWLPRRFSGDAAPGPA